MGASSTAEASTAVMDSREYRLHICHQPPPAAIHGEMGRGGDPITAPPDQTTRWWASFTSATQLQKWVSISTVLAMSQVLRERPLNRLFNRQNLQTFRVVSPGQATGLAARTERTWGPKGGLHDASKFARSSQKI